MVFTFEMLLTLSLMIFAIIGYSSRKFPVDAVSISVLGLLFLIFEIYPVNGIKFNDFIEGFGDFTSSIPITLTKLLSKLNWFKPAITVECKLLLITK